MYNPLYELTPQALVGLIRLKNLYWVQQSYPRGLEMGVEQAFLLTSYDNLAKAQDHFDHIADDEARRLYELDLSPGDAIGKSHDGQDLINASKQPKGMRYFLPYTNGRSFPGWLERQVHEGAKRLGWGGRKMEVDARLGFDYGKLVIRYFCNGDQETVPLETIEKY